MTEATATTSTETTAPVVPEVPKTRREKLVEKYNKLFAKRTEIDAELGTIVAEVNTIDKLGSIAEGSEVVISVGRGEAAKEVTGVVIGVKTDEDGSRLFKVQYGSGFDADVAVVAEGKIKLPAVVAAPADESAAAE